MASIEPLFIAEVKTESPFGFKSPFLWEELLDLAIAHGDIVAVHTDPLWGGSFGRVEAAHTLLKKVGYPQRRHPNRTKPLLLAKGLHPNDEEIRDALDCGADLVLVVGRQPPRELAPVCIWEPANAHDMGNLKDPTAKVMWNARDLKTGDPRPSALGPQWARKVHQGWLCQASFIQTPSDVDPSVDAFIVGEHLPIFVEENR